MVRKVVRSLAVLALLAGTAAIVTRGWSGPESWPLMLSRGAIGTPDARARVCRPIGIPWGSCRLDFVRWSIHMESSDQGGSTDADATPRQR